MLYLKKTDQLESFIVVVVEESYTSKASSIELDPIEAYGQVKILY